MSKFKLSESFWRMLQAISKDYEFKKLQYYMRCLKKAPHGGVFHNTHQSVFMKYYPVQTYPFLSKGRPVPFPIEEYKPTLQRMIDVYDISVEELLVFCFCVDKDDNGYLFGKVYGGDRLFSAMASGVLSLKDEVSSKEFAAVVSDAVDGQIKFTDFFNYDYLRLLDVFILWCVKLNLAVFSKLEDVLTVEQLQEGCDKNGLSDITAAVFERQGFTIGNSYFLYNIFFDTSIGSVAATVPKTIEVIKKHPEAAVSVFMRKDTTLSVPTEKKVTSATRDMQKWRGITLKLNELEAQIKSGKEVIVHFDPQTMHKVITIIKPSELPNHELYYHITVEQLWAPESICSDEDVVLMNFIHGCYYPKAQSFDHIDFSVNQYEKELYIKKYQDSVATTSVSIEQYSDTHYKVWCIRGDSITLQFWSELVVCTLDEPFRGVFAEIIGAEINEEE